VCVSVLDLEWYSAPRGAHCARAIVSMYVLDFDVDWCVEGAECSAQCMLV